MLDWYVLLISVLRNYYIGWKIVYNSFRDGKCTKKKLKSQDILHVTILKKRFRRINCLKYDVFFCFRRQITRHTM